MGYQPINISSCNNHIMGEVFKSVQAVLSGTKNAKDANLCLQRKCLRLFDCAFVEIVHFGRPVQFLPCYNWCMCVFFFFPFSFPPPVKSFPCRVVERGLPNCVSGKHWVVLPLYLSTCKQAPWSLCGAWLEGCGCCFLLEGKFC